MSLVQTPITALASNFQGLSNTATGGSSGFLLSSIFDNFSSVNQLSFLPGYLSSVWSELNFGSTMYVSTLTSPYAVTVGPGNTVGGIYTLTAGISNSNFGSNAFVGGCNSLGVGANVLAYGTQVGAISTNAAAFGTGTWATGAHSVAFGFSSITLVGSNQHAEGMDNTADGTASHAEGVSSFVYSDFSHTEGCDTQIWNAFDSHAEGMDSMISSGTACHVEGLSTFVFGGLASHAEGANTVADVGVAHAEGEQTIALGSSVHTQGYLTLASTYLSSITGVDSIPLVAIGPSNTHLEGTCNVALLPFNHIEGVSTLNLGWVNHNEGLGNSNNNNVSHIEGGSNIMQFFNVIPNASTFTRQISSLLSYAVVANVDTGTGYSNFSTSYLNYMEGFRNVITGTGGKVSGLGSNAPSFLCHIEGMAHSTSGTLLHFEGASNINVYARKINLVACSGTHFEGLSNSIPAEANGTHLEGIRNQYGGGQRHSQSGHFEGFSNIYDNAVENQTNHAHGSNATQRIANGGTCRGFHKEGIECRTNPANGGFVTGQSNFSGNTGCTAFGFCNFTGGDQSFICGQYNYNLTTNNFCVGNCNSNPAFTFTNGGTTINRTSFGSYGLYSNGGVLGYGGVSLFHSTTISGLVRGSAQSQYLSMIAITSTTMTATNFCNFIYTVGLSGLTNANAKISTINYFNIVNTINYPTSNQITYINAIDAKLTGYERRRPNASGGIGFYSGNFSFAIYRDNTNTSNLCIYDMVSQSTFTSSALDPGITRMSTIVAPINEINKLQNTPRVYLQFHARNTAITVPQTAIYGLRVNTNSINPINWQLELEISQVMRP